MTQDFLVEIGTEELPPTALQTLALAFKDGIESRLADAQLSHGDIKYFATPRRLAVLVSALAEQSPDEEIELHGPPADRAKDDNGEWTKAAIGFAKKNGINPDQLETVDTPKGPRLAFRSTRKGAIAKEVLAEIVADSLKKLPIPKRMRWGSSRTEFVRPVHWAVMLFGVDIIDAEILGIQTSNTTRGHRFHCDTTLEIGSPASYQSTLAENGHVIADFNARKNQIHALVEAEGKKLGGSAVIEEDLLNEVTGLVEWPVALTGSFEERFLAVPSEALIYSMSEHQKYFHVVDSDGQLMPNFITVSNIVSTDPAQVIDGNERVIRPRLSDAAFFFETDKKISLADRCEKLKSIVFQKQLGTVFDKSQRIKALSLTIADNIGCNSSYAERAGELCKADLVSDMVFEFDKMQGLAGRYYALNDGEPNEVADAIRDHYLPKFSGDKLPEGAASCAVALADRLDTVVGIFSIGQKPTGSKDPFALRRASISILRILIEKKYALDLKELLNLAAANYDSKIIDSEKTVSEAFDYMIERFRAWYEEDNIPAEVFMAVSAKNLSVPLDINQRVKAVFAFNQMPESQSLAAANKRVSNILAKQEGSTFSDVDKNLLQDDAEIALAQVVERKRTEVTPLLANSDYKNALASLAELRDTVDPFFDQVMVMVDDEALRNNRLALLKQLRALFLEVADISFLVPAK
jgi:glycyl-tRNA synthetase beta chain